MQSAYLFRCGDFWRIIDREQYASFVILARDLGLRDEITFEEITQ